MHVVDQFILGELVGVTQSYYLQSVFVNNFKKKLSAALGVLKDRIFAFIYLVELDAAEVFVAARCADRDLQQFLVQWVAPSVWNYHIRSQYVEVIRSAVSLGNFEGGLGQILNPVRWCIRNVRENNRERATLLSDRYIEYDALVVKGAPEANDHFTNSINLYVA